MKWRIASSIAIVLALLYLAQDWRARKHAGEPAAPPAAKISRTNQGEFRPLKPTPGRLRPGDFLIRVRDAEGKPLDAAEVTLWEIDEDLLLGQAVTNSQGETTLADPPPDFRVNVEKAGFAPWQEFVHAAWLRGRIEAVLRPGHLVRGAVRSRRGGISGAGLVFYSGEEARTTTLESGREGTFSGYLEEGRYSLSISLPPFSIRDYSAVEVHGELGFMAVVVPDLESGLMTGQVLDQQGAGLPKARIELEEMASERAPPAGIEKAESYSQIRILEKFGSIQTDHEGRFERTVFGEGTLLATASAQGFLSESQAVDPPFNHHLEFVLSREPEVRIAVLSHLGEPMEGARITAVDERGLPALKPTSERGRFRVRRLPAWVYAWDAHRGGASPVGKIVKDGQEIVLKLGSLQVSGTIFAAEGEPIERFVVFYAPGPSLPFDSQETGRRYRSKGGDFTLQGLPPGRCQLTFFASGYLPKRVSLESCSQAGVPVTLRRPDARPEQPSA